MKKLITAERLVQTILILILLTAILTSCAGSRNGYGCKGRESWNKMVRRINSPY